VFAAAAAAMAACDELPQTGDVVLDVTIPSNVRVNAVGYHLASPHFALGGHIAAKSPATSFERFISRVPADEYGVLVDAKAVDGMSSCSGSGHLKVRAGATTKIQIALSCVGIHDGLIHIVVDVACPWLQIDSYTVSPLAASVGGQISVSAKATDMDGGQAAFSWSAPTGTFSEPQDESTTYTCASPGVIPLMVSVDDNGCHAEKMATVTCVGDAGADR
jgi:hypothetical protein